MKQIKTTMKIAVIAMMGMSLNVKAQITDTGGDVGIGTTSPKAKLDVNGIIQVGSSSATGGGIIIAQKYAGNDYLGTLSSNYSSGALIMGYGAAGMPNQGASGQLVSTFDNWNGFRSAIRVASGTFEFVSSPTKLQTTVGDQINVESRFLIDNKGFVGIGTTTPSEKLDIKGGLKLGDGSTYTDLIFKTGTPVDGSHGVFEILPKTMPGGGIAKQITYFKNASHSNGKTQHNVAIDGNVGIGTTNPKVKLDIYGSNSPISFRILGGNTNANSATINLGVVNGRDWEMVAKKYVTSEGYALNFNHKTVDYQGPITFSWMGNEKARIEPNGNLGLGLNKPLAKLHIFSGNSNGVKDLHASSIIEGTDARLQLMSSNAGSNGSSISLTNESSSWTLHQKTASLENRFDIGYRVSSESEDIAARQNIYFSILKDGNVGIGTVTTGNHKLAVEGSIGAREIKVEASGWSDFVFYEDYELPTLLDVENHIKEKGHLKDIPTAKEVEKNGFFLGEMDAKLLQKIEELTLYTIEQEKKLKIQRESFEQQQEEINVQKKEIEKLKKQNSEIKELKALVQKLLRDKK